MSTHLNPKSRKIAIGADHAGFELKEKLKKYLTDRGHTIFDCGTFSTESVDYPAIAFHVARLIGNSEYELGIIVDGAGIGSAMAANKVAGVRAALCYDLSTARNSREHNNANVLTLGAGLIGFELAKQIVDVWLASDCTVDRHLKRVNMISEIEKGNFSVNTPSQNNPQLSGLNMTEDDIKKIASKIQLLLNQEHPVASHLSSSCENPTCNSCGKCADKAPDAVRKFVSMGATRISNAPGGIGAAQDIASYIDHTILKPEATIADIKKLCQEAVEYQFAAVYPSL